MADTTIATGNQNTRHLREFIMEWTRNNRFSKYTGTSMNNVIFQKSEAVTGRQPISIPLINRVSAAGQTGGGTTLVGNEENYGDSAWLLTPTYRRHAIAIEKEEADKPNFDAVAVMRPLLSQWAKDKHRDLVLDSMGAIYNGTTYSTYAAATEGAKDTWLTNNADRVLFGAAIANGVSNDHSVALALVDAVADVLTPEIGSLAKRMGQTADSHIKPLRTTDDEEWFVMFCNSLSFRDLSTSTSMQQATREAWSRGANNPLFTGGDLVKDSVIYREVPEIAVIAGVGGAGIDVAPNYLCGQMAVAWGIGMSPRFTRKKEDDYEFDTGVGIMFKDDITKVFRDDSAQEGMVTVYTAGVADA